MPHRVEGSSRDALRLQRTTSAPLHNNIPTACGIPRADPLTMLTSTALDKLYSLDITSPKFLRGLYAFIRSDEGGKHSAGLNGVELTRLVDFLDKVRPSFSDSYPNVNKTSKALSSIPPSDDIFRQCLRKLRALCSSHATLPTSHIIGGDLVRLGDSAIAWGGFADVWQGEHNGKKVCIKAPRVPLNDTAGRRQVRNLRPQIFLFTDVLGRCRHSSKRRLCGND